MEKITNPIDDMLPVITAALESWKAENSQERLGALIKKKLDEKSHEVVLKILGFDNSWGDWRLDNCNGRQATSIAGNYFKAFHESEVEAWLSATVMPEIPEKVMKQLRESAQLEFMNHIRHNLRSRVIAEAEKELKKLVEEVVVTSAAEKYIQTVKLISQ